MKNERKLQTILFVGLIGAMILPFSNMNFADAEKTGRDIIKQDVNYKSMPTIEDVKKISKNKDTPKNKSSR